MKNIHAPMAAHYGELKSSFTRKLLQFNMDTSKLTKTRDLSKVYLKTRARHYAEEWYFFEKLDVIMNDHW